MTNVPPPPPGDSNPDQSAGAPVPPAPATPPPAAPYTPPAAATPPPPAPSYPHADPQGQPAGGPNNASASAPAKKGLSLTSFILGVGGLLLLSWIAVLGLLVGVAAVILGFIAKGKEQGAPKWMWIVGIIAGFVTIAVNIFITVAWVLFFVAFGTSGMMPTAP